MTYKNLDLAELLPKQYRNRTITTLIRSLFNNHLSQDESVILYGYVGSEAQAASTDIYLRENDLERQVNQLSPVLYSKQGVEEKLVTWRELIQRMVSLGIPYDGLAEWMSIEALNFVPFIDLDKFCNFDAYVWIGSWVLEHPTLSWDTLGIPIPAAITALATFNPSVTPDYYVIARGDLLAGAPVPSYPGLTSWSDWALGNMWVHKTDAFAFQLAHPMLNTGKLVQAVRPIIEYERDLKLSLHFTNGEPTDSGTLLGQRKTAPNQLPLFDLYFHDGAHSSYISSAFYYAEAPNQPVDEALGRRIVRDSAADLIFAHSFISPEEDRPLFLKRWDGSAFQLASPWRGSADIEQAFVKYETSGTLVNADKLQNYESYYWAGGTLPTYNPYAVPEYVVIEAGGTSGWSTDNRWKHVNELTTEQRLNYQQASRPIIEFNVKLEAELLNPKTTLAQLPKFKLWAYDSTSGTYVAPASLNSRLTDAYSTGTLFADVTSLPLSGTGILTSAEQAALTLSVRGHQFAQSLLTGYYDSALDSITYNYTVREFERLGAGNGQLSVLSIDPDALPHVMQLQCLSDGVTFEVSSTVLGTLPNLTVDTPYSVAGLTFSIVSGTSAFDASSVFKFDVKSPIFKKTNLYVHVDGEYRTVSTLDGYLSNASLDSRQMLVDPLTSSGAWKCPQPLFGNLDSIITSTFRQGDMYSHFLSIIEAQAGLVGTAAGYNNWRLLAKDYSRGGLIKIYNDRFQLLLGLLCQDSANPISLLDFGQEAYSSALNRTREFVELELLDRVVAGRASALSSTGVIDDDTYRQLRSYLENQSAVVSSSTSQVDDGVNMPFANSSMSLKALTLTAPYLGLAPAVAPQIGFDVDQNIAVLVHHDGHSSPLPTVDFSVLKRLVTKRFKRSNGQETAGFVGGPVPPTNPYARQLWLDLSGERLYFYDVLSDKGELPSNAVNGQFSCDRLTGEVWQFNGTWVALGSDQSAREAPWRLFDLAATLQALLLRLETELYENCPSISSPLSLSTLQGNARWPGLMQREFERFAATHGIVDPYECAYEASNGFTWNYTGSGGATWQSVYTTVYGTSRPDLFPWISCGYPTETAFMSVLETLGVVPPGTTTWDISYWQAPLVVAAIRVQLSGLGRPTVTSVNLATGQLLPPYANGHVEQLLSSPPATPTARFAFGDLGPVELMWSRTLAHGTAMLKTYFRLDPLTFVNRCWGDELLSVDGYELTRPIGRKAHIADVILHGEPINRTTLSTADVSLTCTLAPLVSTTYIVEVASAKHAIFRVAEANSLTPTFCPAAALVLGAHATGAVTVPRDGLNLGDQLEVLIGDTGVITVAFKGAPFKLEGLSQLYAHFHLFKNVELSYSADRVKLASWAPKLAYRFNTLIDTDVFKVKLDGVEIDDSGYKVYLKETELQTASWLTGLRVSLLQRGSTQLVNGKSVPAKTLTGQRGDDWLFRVDLTNPNHPALQWYEYDAGQYETFYALDSKSSQDEWRKHTGRTGLRTLNGPFVVKGLQALVTFIYGYADRAAELGFIFNDEHDPVTDPTTGRPVGWQLLIEQLIDAQFNNPSEGGVFEAMPFRNRLWFKTSYGYISDLSKPGSAFMVPGLYTTGGVRAPKGSFRVFRDGPTASITSDVPLVGALVATSVFEHVVVLENTVGSATIANPFLNQHVDRIFFEGFKQQTPTGLPVYGGKYLVGNQMRTNMEGSIQQLSNLYDIGVLKSEAVFDRASALVSFDRKDYHVDLGTTLPTQLQFWRGMLKSKGTNRAVSSFINSALYRSAMIDELWAYKIADYGDLRRAVKVELNVNAEDMVGERANYLLLENDELAYVSSLYESGGYDMMEFDELAFDLYTLYTNSQVVNMDYVDPRGCIIIKPDDEARWNSFTDLGSIAYMKAMIYALEVIVPLAGGYDMSPYDDAPYDDDGPLIFTIHDATGKEVVADCFEIVDIDALTNANVYNTPVLDITAYMKSGSKIYRESGEYVVGSDPIAYTAPKFKRINSSQIQILDDSLVGKRLLIVAYGPPLARFSPSQLYRDEGGRDTPVNNNVIWWDPARGVHSPAAHSSIDYQTPRDPARYNVSTLKYKVKAADSNRVWGPEQVGKFWWNTNNAGWMSYSDTKLYPDHNERLAQWGALADWASIDVHEWVASETPPASYSGTGEVAVKNYLTRSRTWWQRPVLWLYSTNAETTAKAPLKVQTVTLELFNGSIIAADGPMPTFDTLERIARIRYTDTTRTVIAEPIGTLEVIDGDVSLIVGSSTAMATPTYNATPSFTDVALIANDIVSRDDMPYGAVTLDYEQEIVGATTTTYLRGTLSSGKTQRVLVQDTPVKAGTQFELNFDSLGFKLSAKTAFGHADSWGSGVLTSAQRILRVGVELGSALHDIVLRQQLTVTTLIDLDVTTLDGAAVTSTYGWASWLAPTRALSADDLDATYGGWEAIAGAYTAVGPQLNDLKIRIQNELTTKQPTMQYEERWLPWKLLEPRITELTYNTSVNFTHAQTMEALGFDTISEVDAGRIMLFINGVRVVRNTRILNGASGYYVYVPQAGIAQGSRLRAELPFKIPTGEELKLVLEGTNADPTKLVEFKHDTPYVMHEERNEFGRVSKTTYYYWVKHKEAAAPGKTLSVKLAAQQLTTHPGPYAVPQVLKRFNQLDGRPNRYALLTLTGLTRFVRKDDSYKLRITENGSMRDDDHDTTLRTTHSEWKLIRKNQPTKIPKELWDKLVDTLCGETATGQALPFMTYTEYDSRNGTTSRIGLKQGQVLADIGQAIATLTGTLRNTQVVTYDETANAFISSPIEFAGYDLLKLDTYLESPTSIREFMANLWNKAAPRNINELFFAVLDDSLAASYELADVMKTSYVTLDEVRTVMIEG